MNRAQRREIQKVLRDKSRGDKKLSKNTAKSFTIRLDNQTQNDTTAWEGEKVVLDLERIKSYPDWKEMRKDYREWVEAHEGEIFTVEFDPEKKKNSTLDVSYWVQLVEDTTEPKWLFWAGDLIRQPNQEKPKSTKQIEREKHDKYVESVIQNLV